LITGQSLIQCFSPQPKHGLVHSNLDVDGTTVEGRLASGVGAIDEGFGFFE
jgi:hypothetical protein